jgi:Ca2+-binding RTX toxin-like protein
MVPDHAIDTSANRTTSPLFPNTAQADLGISSGRSAVDSQFSKPHGLPSSLNSEITATSVFQVQNNDSLIRGDGSGRIFADTGKDIINAPEAASSIFAGEGNKIITRSHGDDTIYAQAGNDIINGPFGNNRIASRPRQQPRHHR